MAMQVTIDSEGRQAGEGSYTAKDMAVLEGLEPVRKRPGMYIGSTGLTGLHHLVWEVVDNSVDEAMAGYCSQIDVTLLADGGCRVVDDGRGIPIDINPQSQARPESRSPSPSCTAGGKFGGKGYKVSGGLHGVGVSVVNALSSRLIVEVDRDGQRYRMEFANGGKPQGKLEVDRPRAQGPPGHDGGVLARSHIFEDVRVPGPDHHRAAADVRLLERRPRDPLRRRARGPRARTHRLQVRRRHHRFRPPPQRVQGGALQAGRLLQGGRGGRARSRSPSSGTRATTRASTATPTASPPPRAACTKRASRRP